MSRLLPRCAEVCRLTDAIALFDEYEGRDADARKYARWYGYEFFVCRRPVPLRISPCAAASGGSLNPRSVVIAPLAWVSFVAL
jgi:hypothetical protein